jgi:hypothetical protein
MTKLVPGSMEFQTAIDSADAAIQRALNNASNQMDMLASIALQAIYDEVV